MEESVSSSRTTAFHGGANSCHHGHHHHQPPAPPPPAAATPTTASDFEDADDSGWTAYFLQLASNEEEEEEDASASNRDAVSCGRGRGRGRGSASSVSKPNKDKADNNTEKVGVKKTRILDEEDPLQDTASSPLVHLNINDGDLQEVWSTPAGGRDRLPVPRRRSGGDIVNGNGTLGHLLSDR